MKRYYFILVFILSFNYAFAQNDFREGYVILQGDTIKGLVDYRGAARSARIATFKTAPEDTEKVYSPEAITGYGFLQERKAYEAILIPATDSTSEQKAFLNLIVKGKASLYTLRDSVLKDHYYILKEGGPLTELVEKEYYKKNSAGNVVKVSDRRFIHQLLLIFSECESISAKNISEVKLSQNSLSQITREFNKCINPDNATFYQPDRKIKLQFGPVVGINNAALKFKDYYTLTGTTYKNESLKIVAGITTNITLPAINDKLSLQLDLLYAPYKYTSSTKKQISTNRTDYTETVFEMDYLRLPLQLRYTYPKGVIRPFLNAGLMWGYALKSENKTTKTIVWTDNVSQTQTTPALPNDGFNNQIQGFTAGLGLKYQLRNNFLFLEARYESNSGITSVSGKGSSLNTFYLLMSYSLN